MTGADMTTLETHAFKAETKNLLELMIHSLYTDKEVFLRELVSNASDALDRIRFESLLIPDLRAADEQLEIRITTQPAQRTLSISDNGVGMTRDELVRHIGTIAFSGTGEVREQVGGGDARDQLATLIGRFGVGFYSAFTVAEKVVLVTRRAGTAETTRWESNGDGTYAISAASRESHGTTIVLHLRQPDDAAGVEDFTDQWKIAALVERYADFITYPIVFEDWHDEPLGDPADRTTRGQPGAPIRDRILNQRTPLWSRPPQGVSRDEYHQFYRHLTHDWDEPLKTLWYRAEGRHEFTALLFVPSRAPRDLYYPAPEAGLRLFAQRVMVMERTEELLPRYLRFLKGVVDVTDLPLHISRQRLQQDLGVAVIRPWLTRKVLESIAQMRDETPTVYPRFWGEFGRAIKEGLSSDYENRTQLLDLVILESSHDPVELTTLREYVGRMQADQEHIYYITGSSRTVVEGSPHAEAVREAGYEVLYLIDSVDELLVQTVTEFGGKTLKSIGKGRLSVGSQHDRQQAEAELAAQRTEFEPLLALMARHLESHVKEARLSTRLTRTPACLVVGDLDCSPHLERLLLQGSVGGPKQRRVLELNPKHGLCRKLLDRYRDDNGDPRIIRATDVLFNAALLAEGSELADPVSFTRTLLELLDASF
jgi:molecular chaperone HtpG